LDDVLRVDDRLFGAAASIELPGQTELRDGEGHRRLGNAAGPRCIEQLLPRSQAGCAIVQVDVIDLGDPLQKMWISRVPRVKTTEQLEGPVRLLLVPEVDQVQLI